MSDLELYYWDGSEGCDLCQANTGYSVEEPTPPHPHCNCLISQVTAQQESECYVELRNLQIDSQIDTTSYGPDELDNCDGDHELVRFAATTSDDDSEDFDAGVRQLAESEGWVKPPVETYRSESFTIPPHRVGVVQVEIDSYVADFEADEWMVCKAGGKVVSETQIGTRTGHVESFVAIRISSFDVALCPGAEVR